MIIEALFFAVNGIQLYFILAVFSRLWGYQEKNQISLSEPVKGVSVIVIARNEYKNLKKLIPNLLNQQYPDFEILIVDDRSEDPSPDFIRKMAATFPSLKGICINYLPEGVNSKKYALQRAVTEANKEILLLTDADCLPASTDWIKRMAEKIKDQKAIVLGFSPYFTEKGLLNAFIRYETFYTAVQYFSFALAGFPYMGVGRNLAYTKELFIRNKGLEGKMHLAGGDDDLFVNKVIRPDNFAICVHPETYVFSYPKKNWKEWVQQKLRHLKAGSHYNFSSQILLAVLHFSQLMFWILFFCCCFYLPLWLILMPFFRMLANGLIMRGISRKFGLDVRFLEVLLFDIMYGLYIFSFGIAALLKKHIEWKK